MKKPIASFIVAAATMFGTTFTNAASAAEFRTHPVTQACINTSTTLYPIEAAQRQEIRGFLNPGTIVCDVSRAAPLSGRGARVVIRFDGGAGLSTNDSDIECRFAAVNVWGREIFSKSQTTPISFAAKTMVNSIPRTVVNGTFRITCELRPEVFFPSDLSRELFIAYKFPSFTIIEL